MAGIKELIDQITTIFEPLRKLMEVNRDYRDGIRITVGKLADDLNGALLQIELAVAKGQNYEGQARREHYAGIPEKLAGDVKEFGVCSGLLQLQDRLAPNRLDLLKLGIELGQLESVRGLLEELGLSRQAVFRELSDLWPRLLKNPSSDEVDEIQSQLRTRRKGISEAAGKLIEIM